MKVRMKVAVSGPRHDGTSWPGKGEEVEVPDWEGAELCGSGLADPVAERGEPEKAVTPDDSEKRETPKKRAGRPRKTAEAKQED